MSRDTQHKFFTQFLNYSPAASGLDENSSSSFTNRFHIWSFPVRGQNGAPYQEHRHDLRI